LQLSRGAFTGSLHVNGDIDFLILDQAELLTVSAAGSVHSFQVKQNIADSTLAAFQNIDFIKISGSALNSRFLAGLDLGPDRLFGSDDILGLGSIASLTVKNEFYRSTAAAAVSAGADNHFFTDDDSAAALGSIAYVKFGKHALDNRLADAPFGLIAADTIAPFRLNRQTYQAPYQQESFCLRTL
jgi:hypothetical protein